MTFFLTTLPQIPATPRRNVLLGLLWKEQLSCVRKSPTVFAVQGLQHTNTFVVSPHAVASDLPGLLQRICVQGRTDLKRFVELYL